MVSVSDETKGYKSHANREKRIPSLNGSYGQFGTFLGLNFYELIYALSDTTWKATVLVRSLKLSPVGRGKYLDG